MVFTAALAIAGCDKVAGDKGVLATVGNEKITQADLDIELKASGTPQAKNPVVQRAALEQIVTRKLLAQAAREDELDRAPDAAVMKAANIETFEAGLELRALQRKVVKPTPAEVSTFIQGHPEMFAQRTGYLVERLQVTVRPDADLVAALEPTKTLEQVVSVLDARGIKYRRVVDQVDTLRADPRLTTAIRKLAPGEPFVTPEPDGFSVSSVRQTAVQPVVGADATRVASTLILADRRAKAIKDRLEALRKERVKMPAVAKAETAKPK